MRNWHVNQQVVCIQTPDGWVQAKGLEPPICWPVENGIYTIIAIQLFDKGKVGLSFKELADHDKFEESAFRPLVKTKKKTSRKKKTKPSISIFTAMLIKSPKKAKKNEPASA